MDRYLLRPERLPDWSNPDLGPVDHPPALLPLVLSATFLSNFSRALLDPQHQPVRSGPTRDFVIRAHVRKG